MILLDYPGHLIAIGLAVITAFLLVLAYRTPAAKNIRTWRWVLWGLQYSTVIMVLIILWNPARPRRIDTTIKNSVLVFFDTSESMSVADQSGKTRLDAAVEIFDRAFQPGDPERPEFRIYGFDGNCYNAGAVGALRKWGNQTDLHKVLALVNKYDLPPLSARDSAEDEFSRSEKVTGAVVFTDGQAGDKNLNSYLYSPGGQMKVTWIGMGRPDFHPDAAITSIQVQPRVLIDSTFPVEVQVSLRRMQEQPANLELYIDDHLVGVKELSAKSEKENLSVKYEVGAATLGRRCITAKITGPQNEVNQANNIRRAVIEVMEPGKLKILFYSQVANFDIGKIREVLERDKKVQLCFGLDAVIPPTLSRISREMCGHFRLPEQKNQFYAYDIIILGPCALDKLTAVQVQGLYSFVADRGGGLIFLPGRGEFDLTVPQDEKIKTLLPVEFNGEARSSVSPEGEVHLTLEGLECSILGQESRETVPELAAPYYADLKKKPAATVLIDTGQETLACVHRVGRGRVGLINMYGLFRWYQEDHQGGLLQRFMAGMTAYVGRVTTLEAGVDVFVKRSLREPSKMIFEAHVFDHQFTPVSDATVLLTLDGENRPVRMDPTDKGKYVTEIDTGTKEAILVQVEAELNRKFLGQKAMAFNLPLPKTEMDGVELDEPFLKVMAEKTRGTYLKADQVTEKTTRIFDPRTKVAQFSHLASVWTRWTLFISLCFLVCANWLIRRALGLV
jgi:hypothetical protein